MKANSTETVGRGEKKNKEEKKNLNRAALVKTDFSEIQKFLFACVGKTVHRLTQSFNTLKAQWRKEKKPQ